MLSLNYENINYVITQILKLSCASFSYVNISYVLAILLQSRLVYSNFGNNQAANQDSFYQKLVKVLCSTHQAKQLVL